MTTEPISAELVTTSPRGASLPEKIEYARHLAESGLLPAHYRKQPANVLYAYEYGEMLNLAPMAAITGIHVIEGKPSASSALMSALVRRAGHRLRIFGDDEKAVVEIIRRDDQEFTFRAEWTLQRATQAGLANKDVWKKYPAAMLKARAISECARDACEEALLGMHYTPEELGADVNEDGVPLRVTAERVPDNTQSNTQAEPLPDIDWTALIDQHETAGDLPALGELWKTAGHREPANEDLRVLITEAAQRVKERATPDADTFATIVDDDEETRAKKLRQLFAILGKGMVTDDGQRHEIATRVLQRKITTFTDLTTDDAQVLIDTLGSLADDGPLADVFPDLPEAGSAGMGL